MAREQTGSGHLWPVAFEVEMLAINQTADGRTNVHVRSKPRPHAGDLIMRLEQV